MNTVVSASTPKAPSPVTVPRVMQDPAVNRTSMSVLPTPARMTAHVWIALATTAAFACQVLYIIQEISILNEMAAFKLS